jgi:hypothetical protein
VPTVAVPLHAPYSTAYDVQYCMHLTVLHATYLCVHCTVLHALYSTAWLGVTLPDLCIDTESAWRGMAYPQGFLRVDRPLLAPQVIPQSGKLDELDLAVSILIEVGELVHDTLHVSRVDVVAQVDADLMHLVVPELAVGTKSSVYGNIWS